MKIDAGIVRNESIFIITSWLVFFLLGLYGIFYHELWLDEMQHWLLARDSHSLTELWINTRYEGHPLLWNLFLYGISVFTDNPLWMQIFHICIASIASWFFLKYAPFNLTVRILFIFGYFTFYEYNLISRNYSLSLIFLFSTCILWKNRRDNYLLMSICLAIAANIHLLSLLVSSAFILVMAADFLKNYAEVDKLTRRKALLAGIIFTISLVIAFVQIIPPKDHTFASSNIHFDITRFFRSVYSLWQAFIPIPDFRQTNYWNKNLIANIYPPLAYLLAVISWIVPAVFFIRKPSSMLLFYGGAFLLLIYFTFTFVLDTNRYKGYFYILFILSCWISVDEKPVKFFPDNLFFHRLAHISNTIDTSLLYGILITNCIAGIMAFSLDIVLPFSQSKNVADFLITHGLSNRFVAASSYNALPPLSGYLRKNIYALDIDTTGSFCKWNTPFKKFLPPTQEVLLQKIEKLVLVKRTDWILVLNYPIFSDQNFSTESLIYETDNLKVKQIKYFERSVVKNENFYLYHIIPNSKVETSD
jgi:hypothetical protein